ncbi:MAG: DUF3857 domain-containing protein [Cytophagaceae bacterium]
MSRNFLIVALLSFSFIISAFSQELDHQNYDWDEVKLQELNAAEKALPEIMLKEKKCIEFAYDGQGNPIQYILYHKIVRVNSDKAIEKNNKIYVRSDRAHEYIKHKARVISPNGKAKELSESDIKEAVDEETKARYRYFALSGLEIGSQIEYLYLMKVNPNFTGAREVIQDEVPKKLVEFSLIAPQNLLFKFKSYNNLPEIEKDTARKDKNVYGIKLSNVPGIKKEEFSAYRSSLQQFVYKLNANKATGKSDIVTYGSISESIYNQYFVTEKTAEKKIKKLVQNINLKFVPGEEEKIRAIEYYIKNNFVILENNNAYSTLDKILDNKISSQYGIVKLYAAVFNHLNIEYQIVLTSDRKDIKFDNEFHAYNFLDEFLFYFPNINNYISPTNVISCLGFIPTELTNNYGLFIKKVQLNNYSSGVGKIKFIDPVPYEKSYSNHIVKVDFKNDITKPSINCETQMAGYYAQYYQPYYSYMKDEDKKKVTEAIMTNYMQNIDLQQIKVENEGKDFFGVKPFIVRATFTSDNLIEKAGERYLFKVGELIGVQHEMYQDQERKLDVENDFNRGYHRIIEFEVPAGYKVMNPEILNMDFYLQDDGDKVAVFNSKYKVEGNKYTIEVTEYYKKLWLPVSKFQDFRKVINAAADFNKLTIVLQKQ